MIFLDLNEFGRIDKEYGHVFGDRILQEVAALFTAGLIRPAISSVAMAGMSLQLSAPGISGGHRLGLAIGEFIKGKPMACRCVGQLYRGRRRRAAEQEPAGTSRPCRLQPAQPGQLGLNPREKAKLRSRWPAGWSVKRRILSKSSRLCTGRLWERAGERQIPAAHRRLKGVFLLPLPGRLSRRGDGPDRRWCR